MNDLPLCAGNDIREINHFNNKNTVNEPTPGCSRDVSIREDFLPPQLCAGGSGVLWCLWRLPDLVQPFSLWSSRFNDMEGARCSNVCESRISSINRLCSEHGPWSGFLITFSRLDQWRAQHNLYRSARKHHPFFFLNVPTRICNNFFIFRGATVQWGAIVNTQNLAVTWLRHADYMFDTEQS